MKTTTLLLAAGIAATAYADSHNLHAREERKFHAHQKHVDPKAYPAYAAKPFRPSDAPTCGCYSYTTTWYGAPTLVPDLREYTVTTSSGWETLVPKPTATASPSKDVEEEQVKPAAASSTGFEARRKGSSSKGYSSPPSSSEQQDSHDPPSVYEKKASPTKSSASVASSSKAPVSSYAPPTSSSTSSSAASSSTATANNTITPNGDKWAFCYTPYDSNGECKTADAVTKDVKGIRSKGFTSIRLYATDCDGPQNVGAAAAKEGLKLILGVWVDESGIGSNTDAQVATLTKWGKDNWDLVEMVVAGNEAMFYGYTDAPGLAAFVKDVRSKFRAAGFNGPVGTSEVPGTFTKHADVLCPAVDYAAANIHPFFNTEISAENAGDFVVEQLDSISKACNGEKEAYNLESGWPSLGTPNGLAIPSVEEQKTAIKSIMAKAGNRTAVFSYENDSWKAPGEFGVEQHWGCSELFE